MAKPKPAEPFNPKTINVSSKRWDELNSLRLPHESFEKMFIRVLPKLKEVMMKEEMK
jgi:hypothetical protein